MVPTEERPLGVITCSMKKEELDRIANDYADPDRLEIKSGELIVCDFGSLNEHDRCWICVAFPKDDEIIVTYWRHYFALIKIHPCNWKKDLFCFSENNYCQIRVSCLHFFAHINCPSHHGTNEWICATKCFVVYWKFSSFLAIILLKKYSCAHLQ